MLSGNYLTHDFIRFVIFQKIEFWAAIFYEVFLSCLAKDFALISVREVSSFNAQNKMMVQIWHEIASSVFHERTMV